MVRAGHGSAVPDIALVPLIGQAATFRGFTSTVSGSAVSPSLYAALAGWVVIMGASTSTTVIFALPEMLCAVLLWDAYSFVLVATQ